MTKVLNVLKEQLRTTEKRLEQNEDYKEFKILTRVIEELTTTPVVHVPVGIELIKTKKKRRKNIDNSPLAHLPRYERAEHLYNLVEEMVKKNGGEMDIPIVSHKLSTDHGIKWPRTYGQSVANYVYHYNQTNEKRLILYPTTPENGKKRVTKYTKIFTVTAAKMRQII